MNGKKFLSWILCAAMCLSMFPANAFAEEIPTDEPEITQIEYIPESEENTTSHEEESSDWYESPDPLSQENLNCEEADDVTTDSDISAVTESASSDVYSNDDSSEISSEIDIQVIEPITVEFDCLPETALITVYSKVETDDAGDFLKIEPEEDGTYLLIPGIYLYDAEAEGFKKAEKEEFEITAGEEQPVHIVIVLSELPEEEPFISESLEDTATDDESAIENNLPETGLEDADEELETETGLIEDEENLELDPQESIETESEDPADDNALLIELTTHDISCQPAQDGSGAVDVTVRYALSAEAFTAVSEPVLTIGWTGPAVLLQDSISSSAENNDSFDIDAETGCIRWILSAEEDCCSFRLETETTCKLYINALFSCVYEGQEFTVVYDEAETTAAHFDASFSYNNAELISVTGFAPAGSAIQLLLDHTLFAETTAADDGSFAGVVTVPDWTPETVHTVQVQCVLNDRCYQKAASFYRKSEQPELIGIKYYDHAGADSYVDIYAAMQEGKPASINYTGNDDPFLFVLEYNHPELVDRVYVTATVNGIKYSVEALYDEPTNTYIAEGYFIEGNKRVPPSSIFVEYTPSGTVRTVNHDIDVSSGSDLYTAVSNDFPNATAQLEPESTSDNSIYTVNLQYDGTEEELINTAFEYAVKAIDYTTGLELFDQYKQDIRYLSYIIPELDEDRYLLNIDLTDPEKIKMLLVDTADGVNKAFEYVVSCYDSTATREQYLKWLDVSEAIGTVTTYVDIAGDMYDIYTDTKDLKEEIRNAAYMSEEQKETAYVKADELNSDRVVFTLLTTMLPLIAATGGGAAAPIALFGAMIWVMGTVSDSVFDTRAANIKMGDVDVEWAGNTGEGSFVDTDGLTYSFSYYLDLRKTEKYEYGNVIGYSYYYYAYLDIVVSGSGESKPSKFSHYVSDFMWDIRQQTGIPVSSYTTRSLTYSYGVTGISSPIYCSTRICAGFCKITLAETVTSFCSDFLTDWNYTAGSIGTDSLLEFDWKDIPSGVFSSNSHLKAIRFSNTVRSIGDEAFSGCENLTEVVLPDSVTTIGMYAFSGCTGIETLILPQECSIYVSAFSGCSSLKHLTLHQVNEVQGTASYQVCPFPSTLESVSFEGTTTICAGLLRGLSNIQTLSIPEGVTAIGNSAFEDCTGLISVSLPESLTSIGRDAFRFCTSLTGIRIPATVTEIGSGAFYGIETWTTAGPIGGGYDYEFGWTENIPGYAFYPIKNLSSVTLPKSLKTIGYSAFAYCSNLSDITLPEGLTSIGYNCFYQCKSLPNINLPDSLSDVASSAFDGCSSITEVRIPKNLTGISSHMFSNCSKLNKVTLPEGITYIGDNAFYGCPLKSVDFPKSLTSIGSRAFEGNYSLAELRFTGSGPSIADYAFVNVKATAWFPGLDRSWDDVITSDYRGDITWKRAEVGNHCGYDLYWEMENGDLRISGTGPMWEFDEDDPGWYEPRETVKTTVIEPGAYNVSSWAFNGCSNMTSIELPDGITSIGAGAFYGCKSLKTITVPKGVTSIGRSAFWNCSGLTKATLPDSLTTLDAQAFADCSSLQTIVIPNQVTKLQGNTFVDCRSLASVTMPASLESISYSEFYGCRNLKSIVIPPRVKSIGSMAFYVCNALKEIRFQGSAPNFEKDNIFTGVTATAYYPADDSSWTDEVMQDYGGTITWKPYQAPTQIILDQTAMSLKVAEKVTLNADVGDSGIKLKWSSSDTHVASVTSKGVVTANGVGEADITVITEDSTLSASCHVKVLFTDVSNPADYFYEPVYWAVKNGITNGTSTRTFSPYNACTRGQIVTFLWKAMGSPEPSTTNNPFTDVNPSDYFYKPVLWAKESGITSGKTATTFAPTSPCTRGQIVTFLWIAKGRPEPSSTYNPFTDVKTSDYFYKSVLWAKEAGITSGTSATTFGPGKTCTRAQAMAFLWTANGKP